MEVGLACVTSTGIGLLVGLERERNPDAKAGLRTFALIALFGTLTALVAELTGSGWLPAVGAAIVGLALAGAHLVDPRTAAGDSGLTSVIAALVVFCLGAINFHGYRFLAVALGVGVTALLHFKIELEGVAQRLTPRDMRSILQFAAVTVVVLPLLPNEPYGPYGALNPFHIWLMVVLISGVSLAGYVAWRLTKDGTGLIATGLLGGLVSSTATSLVYARHAASGAMSDAQSAIVIVLANVAMLVRVMVLVLIVAPGAAWAAALPIVPAILIAGWAVAVQWRKSAHVIKTRPEEYRNPASMLASMLFAAGYAIVLLVAAWLSETFGTRGLYGLAVASGLTDVDAITLSSLRLFSLGTLTASATVTSIALAVGANLAMKAVLVAVVGGTGLRRVAPRMLLLPAIGLAVGWVALGAVT